MTTLDGLIINGSSASEVFPVVRQLEPSGSTFTAPSGGSVPTLRMRFLPNDVEDISTDTLRIKTYDEASSEWIELPHIETNMAERYTDALLSGFSKKAISGKKIVLPPQPAEIDSNYWILYDQPQ